MTGSVNSVCSNNTTRQLIPKRDPQVGRGLFGICLRILSFKFQFSKYIKSSTFHSFLNLTFPLRKNISFPKCPKITQKCTQNRQIVVNEISRLRDSASLASLETWPRYWQKGHVSDVKTAFVHWKGKNNFSI